jgi:hypothetical protein
MTIERPMFPPVDTTRRHLLTIAAGGAVAAAIPTAGERINLGANETNVLAPKTSSKEITLRRASKATRPWTSTDWDNDPMSRPKVQQSDGVAASFGTFGTIGWDITDPRRLSLVSPPRGRWPQIARWPTLPAHGCR